MFDSAPLRMCKFCMLLEGSVTLTMGGKKIGVLPDPESDDDPQPIFGEAAVLSTRPSQISVTTNEPCKLLVMYRPKFRRLNALLPDLKEQIRTLAVLKRGILEANLAAHAVTAEVAHMSRQFEVTLGGGKSLRANNAMTLLDKTEAAIRIQRYSRGKAARRRVERIRSSARRAGRAARYY